MKDMKKMLSKKFGDLKNSSKKSLVFYDTMGHLQEKFENSIFQKTFSCRKKIISPVLELNMYELKQ